MKNKEKTDLKITNEDVHYQVMITNDKGEKLAFKQNDKWTINASTEEILDTIFKVMYPNDKIVEDSLILSFYCKERLLIGSNTLCLKQCNECLYSENHSSQEDGHDGISC